MKSLVTLAKTAPPVSCIQERVLKKTTAWNSIEFNWLGLTRFAEALGQQNNHHEKLKNDPSQPGLILGLEHPPVVTLGVRGGPQDLLFSSAYFANQGIECVTTDRGGEATFHNPGQLVIYPILHLKELGLSARTYVELLQNVTMRALESLGIASHKLRNEPGVFTARGKIASVGVRIANGVSRHGVAINVCNDLNGFSLIRVCGKAQQSMDRVANYGSFTGFSSEQLFGIWQKAWFDLSAQKI